MSIYGVGVDLVDTRRIEGICKKDPDSLACRILSDLEIKRMASIENKVLFMTKCFAIKESVAKAFGTGFKDDVYLKGISYMQDERGKPIIELHDSTKEFASRLGVTNIHVSLSDELPYVMAYAVIESA